MQTAGELMALSVMMIFAQNVLFAGSYGLSNLLIVLKTPRMLIPFCVMVSGFSLLVSCLWAALRAFLPFLLVSLPVCGLLSVLLIALLYLAAVGGLRIFNKTQHLPMLSLAAFHSAVLLIPLAAQRLALSGLEIVFFGAFTGVGYLIAAVLFFAGVSNLSNPHIPAAFRGLPIRLLYAGLLSMAFIGFSGQMFSA